MRSAPPWLEASRGRHRAAAVSSLGMDTAVLVLAAGRGERLGGETPKAFVSLAGVPLVVRSIETLLAVNALDCVQPVVAVSDFERYGELDLPDDPRLAPPVSGGALRQDSVAAGLAALPEQIRLVGVHDAARCLVTAAEIEKVLEAAQRHGAAILATPARDTLKQVRSGVVEVTPERASCWVAQTPQVFERDVLARSLEQAKADDFVGTDDAQLVERLGVPVHIVEGRPQNIKITLPGDLGVAEVLRAQEER